MKTQLLILFCFCFNLILAQNNPSPKGSATIQVGRTDTPQANIKIAKTSIQELTTWLEKYEWELYESNKTSGVSPDGRSANLNMSKSNRSASENLIYNSQKGLKDLSISLSQFEKSDTENQRKALSELQQAQNDLDKALELFHKSILERGDMYTDKAAELKARHDTVKNSIGNIRA